MNDTTWASLPEAQGLYHPAHEHDSCGVGFTAAIDGTKSHSVVKNGMEILKNLMHRGAVGGDQATGDGAGILIQIPDNFFRKVCPGLGISLPEEGFYAAAMVFLPRDEVLRKQCMDIVERQVTGEGLSFLGWRDVPCELSAISGQALAKRPEIMQFFVDGNGLEGDAFERKLYVVRRLIEKEGDLLSIREGCFYISSLSCKTLVYKGLFTAPQLPAYYPDLSDEAMTSAVALVHQRYSTNTFPSWELAQPFRYLAHNGEINTLKGNVNHMKSREAAMKSDLFGDDMAKVLPVIREKGSDSSSLDNTVELLVKGGRHLDHAMLMLIPEAWGVKYPMGPDLRGFFEYHAGLMEPWDGPAAVAFSNGTVTGALLDRNGLRPARYTITKDGMIVFGSETGVLEIDPENVAEKGALRPGEILLVDFTKKRVMKNREVKSRCARKQPYRRWVEENRITLRGFYGDVVPVVPDSESLMKRQKLFGYSREDLDVILGPMAVDGQEPVGSMGNDAPHAVLSENNQLLYNYFRQLFAQVTNPPIDPVREELVMSLMTFIGNPGNILSEVPQNSRLIKLLHPILSNEDLKMLKGLKLQDFRSSVLSMGFAAGGTGRDLEDALDQLCKKAETAIENGSRILILSDKNLPDGIAPIPALLAASALNKHLVRIGKRTNAGIVLETGEAREVMHIALLLGYGATAVNPYLAFESVAELAIKNRLTKSVEVAKSLENYIKSLSKGLLKVMSKMGISTLRSYRSAQVFQAVGLSRQLVDRYFTGTSSVIDGIGLDEIAKEANQRYTESFKQENRRDILPSGGHYKLRKDGERHLWTSRSISALQHSVRTNDYKTYMDYANQINDQGKKQSTLRGLFAFKYGNAVPLHDVEPATEIMKRFVTGAMSFGSISKEAHESIAIAMNRIGGRSNSGEGGEDPVRYIPLENGDSKSSAIKQIASGRFGVTTEYLVNAKDLQIKIAQGAKPGEGGQLPGHKVNREIARVRHSTPGVTLISPPPHHDIYSIEDLAQLIFDLKNVNTDAMVSVKLVSEAGVGTVAAGVAKAHADAVLISGSDGGTGASPLSSIKHAGGPWETGLAETQQTLILNGLRDRIRIQVDGQIKTGRDVIVGALLGAEEFGFATSILVTLGCVMMRKCHKNTCPVGIATQDERLRKLFNGKPEYVVNYLRMVAEEAREILAKLGFKTMDEIIGRSDLLVTEPAVSFWKAKGIDLSRIFHNPWAGDDRVARRSIRKQPSDTDDVFDRSLIERAKSALEAGENVVIEDRVKNSMRTVGTMLSGEIAKRYGDKGLPEDTILCRFSGYAGQSFGAFAARGLTMILTGEANDYLGKGLSGGRIIVKPQDECTFDPSENIIAGNVLLYGATAGEVYIYGKAGERFAIRNSGATAVVEGVGDHGCEYMTGGRVVVLGETGINFAAGMSGGIAYVFDPDQVFDQRCNLEMVDLEIITDKDEASELKAMIARYAEYTGSERAREILESWDESLPNFVKVFPMEYRKVLGKMIREDAETERQEIQHG